jgi:glucokinase
MRIGLDIGGTKIRAGLIDDRWNVHKSVEIPTQPNIGKEQVMTNIREAVRSVWSQEVSEIGIGFAGVVDHKSGIVVKAPNFPDDTENFAITKELSSEFPLPIYLDNDVNCFCLSEAKFGAGVGYESVFGLTLGTGIGGGWYHDSAIVRGAHGAAAEIGHMTIDLSSRFPCGCGKQGHFEALASGKALISMCEQCDSKPNSSEDVFRLAMKGDIAATSALQTFRKGLVVGLQNIIYAFDPGIIIVGGGVGRHEAIWKDAAAEAVDNLIFPNLKQISIVPATLGVDANIIGAAMLCAQDVD